MRLEGQDNRGHVTASGLSERAFQNGLMAAVNAIEIADCHHTTPEVLRQKSRVRDAIAGFHGRTYTSLDMTATGR
jgi:hypothetical protein